MEAHPSIQGFAQRLGLHTLGINVGAALTVGSYSVPGTGPRPVSRLGPPSTSRLGPGSTSGLGPRLTSAMAVDL